MPDHLLFRRCHPQDHVELVQLALTAMDHAGSFYQQTMGIDNNVGQIYWQAYLHLTLNHPGCDVFGMYDDQKPVAASILGYAAFDQPILSQHPFKQNLSKL